MAANNEDRINQPYDQFLLFGDSITEMSASQALGFGFHPALQDGKRGSSCVPVMTYFRILLMGRFSFFFLLAYSRRLDVVNRGFAYVQTGEDLFPRKLDC